MNVMVFKPYLQKAGTHSDAAFPERGFDLVWGNAFFDTILQGPNQLFGPHQETTGIIPLASNISDW